MIIKYNESLMHSDKYLGTDFSDGMQHWKYIKREKRNGKWVYYYNDDEYNKSNSKLNNVLEQYKLLNKKINSIKNDKNAAIKAYDKAKKYGDSIYKEEINNLKPLTPAEQLKLNNKFEKAAKDMEITYKKMNNVSDKYNKTVKEKDELKKVYNNTLAQQRYMKSKDKIRKAFARTTVKGLNLASSTSNKIKYKISNIFKKMKKRRAN